MGTLHEDEGKKQTNNIKQNKTKNLTITTIKLELSKIKKSPTDVAVVEPMLILCLPFQSAIPIIFLLFLTTLASTFVTMLNENVITV